MRKLLPQSQILAVHQPVLVGSIVDIEVFLASQELSNVLIGRSCLLSYGLSMHFSFLTDDTNAEYKLFDFLLERLLVLVTRVLRRLLDLLEVAQLAR